MSQEKQENNSNTTSNSNTYYPPPPEQLPGGMSPNHGHPQQQYNNQYYNQQNAMQIQSPQVMAMDPNQIQSPQVMAMDPNQVGGGPILCSLCNQLQQPIFQQIERYPRLLICCCGRGSSGEVVSSFRCLLCLQTTTPTAVYLTTFLGHCKTLP